MYTFHVLANSNSNSNSKHDYYIVSEIQIMHIQIHAHFEEMLSNFPLAGHVVTIIIIFHLLNTVMLVLSYNTISVLFFN